MQKWPWKIYAALLASMVFGGIHDAFSPDSPLRTYYTILIAFNKRYLVFLGLNMVCNVFNLLASTVVFYYAFNIKSSLKFWRGCFFVRIVLDVVGHNYDIQFIKSAFMQSQMYGLAALGAFVLPILPSYLAHYLYAFKKTPRF